MEANDELLKLLQMGAKGRRCGVYLYHMNVLSRQFIYHELESERLTEKYRRMSAQYDVEQMSWNQIAYLNIIKYIGDMRNRGNYDEISRRVSFETLSRERGSLESVEALLIGAAGLLSTLPKSDAMRRFVEEGEYLLHKYKIKPLSKGDWMRSGVTNCKTPVIRLAQMARIIYDNEQLFNRVINCRSRNDIFNLCNVSASESLSQHFGEVTRSIGAMTSDIVGINAIVPLQYAYGHYSGSDELISSAADLNESLPAERNRVVDAWRDRGLNPESAYESQALIELSTTYCDKMRCRECLICQHITSAESALERVPNFLEPQMW